MKTNDVKSMDDFIKGFYRGKRMIAEQNKGKGWKEVEPRPIRVGYGFKCKDCGAQIDGFVVSPRFCPYCGKEHG
jgi:hypothetical protein